MFRTENECTKTCQLPEINPERNPERNPEINPDNPEIKTEISPAIKTEINPEINPEQPVEDVCSLEADPGPGVAYLKRYYFDKNDQKCKIFAFSGCRGEIYYVLPLT